MLGFLSTIEQMLIGRNKLSTGLVASPVIPGYVPGVHVL
jgi:hypothetical protein